uniref:Antigen peptide transporter 1-like n=2 Tax=Salarias fasciatus TaxID=181472 RepID=A0A672G490_SALFA
MQKISSSSFVLPVLCVCVDVCVVRAVRLAQPCPFLLPRPFLALWGGALLRASALLLLSFLGGLRRMRGPEGLQSLAVLCFHRPAYVALLGALGRPAQEELWAWHSWGRVLQGYAVTLVAWTYWSRYVAALLSSGVRWVRSALKTGSAGGLLGCMRPYLWRFVFVLALVMLSSYGEMAVPKYTGHMADWIVNEEAPNAFSEAIWLMAVLTVLSAVLEFVCDLTYNTTMSAIHTSIQAAVLEAVLQQDIAFFDATSTGELVSRLVSRVTTDTSDMSEALSDELSLVMWYTARFVFLLIFMLSQSWKLTLLSCMGVPIIWVLPEFIGHFRQIIAAKSQDLLAKANQVATETFSCIKTVKCFANEDGETDRYRRRMDDIYALNKQDAATYAASTWANSMTSLALKVAILYYGGLLVTEGAVSSGDLVAFVLYELQFTSSLEAVMRCYPEVKKAIGASEKIFEYLDREPQVPPDGSLEPDRLEGHVQFRNVTFCYPGKANENPPVLKNVSLELKPGKITALVGSNRSGKSTCVKLLERFYQLQNGDGEILLDGKPLQSYKDQYLHDQIAVVSQDCLLFARSVRENIKYGRENASEEEMIEAAQLASAHSFITGLPSGYDTDAGEKGGQVSGGQKQRIAIARALIKQPKVLILDNATSDLDGENRHQVSQTLLNQARSCSVLLVSNNMSMVESADHIVVLNGGEVEEAGGHDELMRRGGFYAQQVEKQHLGFQRPEEAGSQLL